VTLQRLRLRLYSLAFIDEFGPLYAVFTLWFNDNGVSVAELSSVFLTWSIVTIVLEIPSGVVADRLDRRHVLGFAFWLRAIAIIVWLLVPTLVGAMIGAGLWAIHSSLASGAWEANVHDQLTAAGGEREYPVVMARVGQLGHLGVALASVVAIAVLAFGGSFEQLGWVTVAVHVISIGLVLTLPDVSFISADQRSDVGLVEGFRTTLRAGIAEARASVEVFHLVILGAFVEGLFLFDEYVPLLARDRGASDATVPILVLIVWAGLLIGGEVVARYPAVTGRTVGLLLVAGAAAMALAMIATPLWTLPLIGVGYIAMQANWVTIDARLQERVGPHNRATVTSVKGFLAGLISGVGFLMIGLATRGTDARPGLYVAVIVIGVIGLATIRWLPDRRPVRQ